MEYTQAQIDEVVRMVNAGEITVQELEAEYGMPAAEIQANLDAINAQTAQQAQPSASTSKLIGISKNPPYDPADVEKVTDLLNSGQIKVNEVAQYFNVPVNDVIKNLTGIPRDTYTSGASTPEDISGVMNMINSGVATPAEVQEYFSAGDGEVEDYLINVEGYTPEDISNVQQGIAPTPADIRNIPVDGDYTEAETQRVTDAINNGTMTSAAAAIQFGVTEAQVDAEVGRRNQVTAATPWDIRNIPVDGDYTEFETQQVTDAINNGTMTSAQVAAQFGVTEEQVDAEVGRRNQRNAGQEITIPNPYPGTTAVDPVTGETTTTSYNFPASSAFSAPAENTQELFRMNLLGGTSATDVGYARGNDIPTGLYGSEMALKGGATGAIGMLDQLNRAGQSSLATQSQAGLSAAEQQKAIADAAIMSGTTQGVDALGAAVASGRTDLRDEYANALAAAEQQSIISRGDITAGRTSGLDALTTGINAGQASLTSGYDAGLANAEAQAAIARGDIFGAETRGMQALNQGLGTARQDLTQASNLARQDISQGNALAGQALNQGMGQARSDISSGSQEAYNRLSGGLNQARGDLSSGFGQARSDLSSGFSQARGDLSSGFGQARNDLSQGYGLAMNEIDAARNLSASQIQEGTTQGLGAFNQGIGQARGDISNAFGRAESSFNPYQQAGTNALQMQQALSGALGQEAFNAAYQESPQIAFLREQGMRANLAGAGATGGLGGGNVQRELARFGQGLASQGLQQQIANLGGLSSQGLNATGSAANIASSGGQNLANLAQQQGSTNLQALQSQGQNLANIYSQAGQDMSGIQQNRGQGLANLAQGQGQGLSNLAQGQGQGLANFAQNQGQGLSSL